MGKNDSKRGFSGLSDLASSITGATNSRPEQSSANPLYIPTDNMNGENKTERRASSSRQPTEIIGSNKSRSGSGWQWILVIFVVIFVVWLEKNGGHNTKKSSYNSLGPESQSNDYVPAHDTLAREIEIEKAKAKEKELQIRDLDQRIEEQELRLNSFQTSGMIDEYNILVPTFNSLILERDSLYEEYSHLIDELNAKIISYNLGHR